MSFHYYRFRYIRVKLKVGIYKGFARDALQKFTTTLTNVKTRTTNENTITHVNFERFNKNVET